MRHRVIRSVFVLVALSVLAAPTMVGGQTVITRGEAIGGLSLIHI